MTPQLKRIWTRLALCGVLALLAVGALNAAQVDFQSRWGQDADRTWAGNAYWANRLQDWRVRDGRLECIHAGRNRNLQLLTYQLGSDSSLSMEVTVSRPAEAFRGWVGFEFARHGRIDEYRHNSISGNGIPAGMTHDGTLRLGNERQSARWDDRVHLRLTLKPRDDHHAAALAVLDKSGKQIAQMETNFPSERIRGNLGLVCHGSGKGLSHGKPITAFSRWTVSGDNLRGGPEQNWGPVLWTQYTLSRGVLKLSAQFPPLGPEDSRKTVLQVKQNGAWEGIARAEIDDDARLALFRIGDWDASRSVPYRVAYRLDGTWHYSEGVVRRDPVDKQEIVVAAFTGNKDYGFPNREIAGKVARIDPDLLFFSGDQIYEDVAGLGMIRTPVDRAMLDYLRKYYLVGWAFGDLLADRPSVIIPDDHDVFQGNLWGHGGRPLPKGKGFAYGGYRMAPEWVRMVERTQTAHLPDPVDPEPIKQNIGVYFTDLLWGRVSFAVLEDRKFKWGSASPQARNNPDQAVLLGERQLAFLRRWTKDWQGCDMKATLSQTVFAQCHTHAGRKGNISRHTADSNGWPPHARNRALREIRKAFAFMIAGDNHLPTVVHHGIEDWEDSGISFTVPSIAAGFPRAWWPGKADKDRKEGTPSYAPGLTGGDAPAYLGRYVSGWEHPLTFLAAANPEVFRGGAPDGDIELLDKKSSGFGVVRFDKKSRDIKVECWRILGELDDPESGQFTDWPVTVSQLQNYGRKAEGWLPTLKISGMEDPVVQVIRESDGEVVYTLRINGQQFRPKVFAPGRYTVKVGEQPDGIKTLKGLEARRNKDDRMVKVSF